MCVDYSSAFLFVYVSVIGVFFRRKHGAGVANAEEVFDSIPTNVSSSSFFPTDPMSSMRQPMADPAEIPEAAQSVLASHPTYEERCFDTPGDGKLPFCWYCDPSRCAKTKNYENPDLANTEWCPSEACNGYNDAEKWEGYNFGCGFERNWCETGTGSETKSQCQEKYRRSETNCNCDPENPVQCPSPSAQPSPPPSPLPLPPPSPPPVSTNTNGNDGGDSSFTNVEVTTIDDNDIDGLFSSPPPPTKDASSADSGFMTPSKLGGAAVGLIGIFFLAAFVGYRNYICAKIMPKWYKNNANVNAATSDEENVPPEWVSNKSASKKNKTKKKKRAPTTKTVAK